MTFDLDLLRDILLQLRADGREFTLAGYAEEDVHRALGYLRRKGHLLATTQSRSGASYEFVLPRKLTEKGDALAEVIERDLVWTQVKQWLPRPEDRVSLDVVRKVAEKVGRMRK